MNVKLASLQRKRLLLWWNSRDRRFSNYFKGFSQRTVKVVEPSRQRGTSVHFTSAPGLSPGDQACSHDTELETRAVQSWVDDEFSDVESDFNNGFATGEARISTCSAREGGEVHGMCVLIRALNTIYCYMWKVCCICHSSSKTVLLLVCVCYVVLVIK